MPPETRSSSQGNKSLSANCSPDRFRAHLTKVKTSDSCTRSYAIKRQKKNRNTSIEPCSSGVIKDVEKEPVSEGAKLQGVSKDLAAGTNGFSVSNRKRKLVHEGFDIGCRNKKLKYIDKTKISIGNIFDRQTSERKELQTLCDETESTAKFEKFLKLKCLEVNRSINSTEAVCTDKLKILEANQRKELEELESEMVIRLKSMKAKHNNERKELEVNCRMNELNSPEDNGLLDNLLTKAAEVIHAKSFTSSGNDLEEEEDSEERGSVGVDVSLLHGPEEPHNDAVEDSSNAEVAANNADRKMDINSDDGDISKSPEDNRLFDSLPTKAVELIPAKSFTSSGNDLEEEDSEERGSFGVHVPLLHGLEEPHRDAAVNSSSAEAAENFADRKMDINRYGGDISKSKSAIQVNYEARLFQNVGSLDVQGIQSPLKVVAEQVEQIATIKNDPLSAEYPTLQQVADANEESAAQLLEILESMFFPYTMNPSVAVPVSQEHATSQAILNTLNNGDVCAETSRDVLPSSDHSGIPCNTSEQVVCIHLPPGSTSPVDAAVSHPVEMTLPCSTSCGAPNILLESRIRCRTLEAPTQEDHMPLNRSVKGSPRPVLDAYPPSHNSYQFQSYMPWGSFPSSSIPAFQEFDPLQKVYERLSEELNQVTKNHKDVVSFLKSERDKEVDELYTHLKMKYESLIQKAVAHNHSERVMDIKLAEAFPCQNINPRTEPQRAQQRQLSIADQNAATRSAAAPPMPLLPLPLSIADQNAATRSAAPPPMPLPPLPEIDGSGSMELDRVLVKEVDGYIVYERRKKARQPNNV